MNRSEFIQEIDKFNSNLKINKIRLKNLYDDDERKEIFRLCRKITRCLIPKSDESNVPIRFESMSGFSISSLQIFDNKSIIDFFEDKLSKMKIVRNKKIELGDADLVYCGDIDKSKYYVMNIPCGKLSFLDQISFSHEYGHIPEADLIRDTYLEHSEALPIFFEYLCELKRHGNHNDALDNFLYEILSIERLMASNVMKRYKDVESKIPEYKLFSMQLFVDDYKYLESLDYSLQLIDIMQDDKKAVGSEIEKIINGKSMIETAKDFDIDTYGCERLLKECKRLSR